MDLFVPWPRLPLTTRTGKESKARRAGKEIPWLSLNVVNNLHHRSYNNFSAAWRRAGAEAAEGMVWTGEYPVIIHMVLAKRTALNMDPYAVLEGAKHVIDGMVEAGVFPDDNDAYVRGGTAIARKSSPLGLALRIETFDPR